jgi:hypothetical protein
MKSEHRTELKSQTAKPLSLLYPRGKVSWLLDMLQKIVRRYRHSVRAHAVMFAGTGIDLRDIGALQIMIAQVEFEVKVKSETACHNRDLTDRGCRLCSATY